LKICLELEKATTLIIFEKMNKKEELKKLEEEIMRVKLPLAEISNLVFGEGNPDCGALFIGEAPGQREDELKRPFVGRSGQLLDKMIGEIGWKRENVYITNIVKRRPPENRDPLPEEIEAYKPYLARQIDIINPKVIAPLGRFSMNYFLPFAKISRDQGKVFEKDGRLIFPLFHPAAALRATEVLNQLREAFKKLPDVVSGKILEPEEPVETEKTKEIKKVEQAKLF
jgi:DNA polymerase